MGFDLFLGKTLSSTPIILRNPENPHISISGRSGCGKSFFLKNLLHQAVRQGTCCIVFDYTGDFGEYVPPNDIPTKRTDVTSSAFTLNPLVSVSDQSADVRAQQLLSHLHSVFRMGPRATAALRNAAQEYLDGSSKPTLGGLLAFIAEDSPSTGLVAATEPLQLLATLFHSGDTPISLDLTQPDLTILDFNSVVDRELRKLGVELILQAIWDQRTSKHLSGSPGLVLVLDEAQNLDWGQNGMAIRILREGRKYGIGGWFASQWIDNKTAIAALGQAALQAHFRPNDQNARQLARLVCPTGGADLARYQGLIRSLQRGQFIWDKDDGKVIKIIVSE